MKNCLLLIFSVVVISIDLYGQNALYYYNKGDSLISCGNYNSAIKKLIKAEKNEKDFLKNRKQMLYGQMAYCYQKLGEYDLALTYYHKQLDIIGKKSPKADFIRLNMSDLLLLTGEYQKVIDILENITVQHEKRIINITSAKCCLGHEDEAIKILDEIISSMKCKSGEDICYSDIYLSAVQNKAYILIYKEKYDDAYMLLSSIIKHIKPDDRYYNALGNLAIAESKTNRKDDAVKHIDLCIEWQKNNLGKHHNDLAVSIRKKAHIMLEKNDIEEAAKCFKQYFKIEKFNIIQNFSYMTEKQRLDYWNSKKNLIAECYNIGNHDPEFLYDVAIFSKSVFLQSNYNFMKLAENDKNISKEYNELKRLIYIKNNSLSTARDSIEKIIEIKERHLIKRLKHIDKFKKQLDISGYDVAKALKRNDRAIEFVRYMKNKEYVYAALMTDNSGKVKYIELQTENYLNNYQLHNSWIMGNLKDAIESHIDNDKDYIYTDSTLAHIIWDPIMKYVPKGGNIYFSPEGIFHLFAIEYMNFYRDDCNIYRLSSTRKLCEKRKRKKYKSILLVGGLEYDSIPKYADKTEEPDRTTSKMLKRDKMPPVVGGGYNFLQGSSNEVDSISKVFSSRNKTVLKYNECDESGLKKILNNFDIVHISTHGYSTENKIVPHNDFMNGEYKEDLSLYRSGILLSGANIMSKQNDYNKNFEDGILSAYEISCLNMTNNKLIVLSACQTGLGKVTQYGVEGMPRGLKKAGAKTIIVSLWEVNDRSTQLLMSFLYNNIYKGMNVYKAFINAQKQLRETTVKTLINGTTVTTNMNQPHLWAPFIIIDAI